MKKNSYPIIKAKNSDIQLMLTFWQATEGIGVGLGDSEPELRLFLKRNPTSCLIMKDKDKLIGTVLGGFDGRRGFIYHLAVDPGYRRQGLGAQLLDKAMAKLNEAGADRIHLFVWNDNQTAIDFYRSLGWLQRHDIEVFTWYEKESAEVKRADTCRC